MNVTLRQLRAFIAVARTGSFTLAAESLFVTQSALSGLIKELEQVLGLRVFERTTRRIHLSEMGRELYPLLEKIVQDLDRVLGDVAERKALKAGLVRIAAPQLLASTLLPEVIAAYQATHPDIQVKLVDSAVESILSRVFSGEVDFGIGPERDANSAIATETLFEGRFIAVFPHGHSLTALTEVHWRDLLAYPFIALQGQFTERLLMDLRAASGELNFAPSSEVAFMSTALAMVNTGLGVTACIAYARTLVERYQLEWRPLITPVVRRRFFTFTHQHRSLTPAAESFQHFICQYVAERPQLFC
ncbi:LysR substrate-binding domain-containing protein [Neisseriaceae bacterium TC5R-5]|nr:LysR substrate-binding domain-containing protein [Neisseriaceae bacterium TC5R-5]